MESTATVSEPNCLPRPRSATLHRPFAVTRTFAGLMSRCMTRRSCMCASAAAICRKVLQTVPSSRRAPAARCLRRRRLRSPPAAHSKTMQSFSSSRNESYISTMPGCRRLPRSCTSRRHRRRFRSLISCRSTCLMATRVPSSRRVPLYTTAYPPLPTARPTSYISRRSVMGPLLTGENSSEPLECVASRSMPCGDRGLPGSPAPRGLEEDALPSGIRVSPSRPVMTRPPRLSSR